MVSHLEVSLPKKPPTTKNIGEALGIPQRYLRREANFVQYDKNKNGSLLSATIIIKYLPEGTKVLCSLIAPSIKVGDFSDAWKFVAPHGSMVFLKLKVLIFINHKFQWHMLNHSESILLLHLCID